jgi:hypothetical protein
MMEEMRQRAKDREARIARDALLAKETGNTGAQGEAPTDEQKRQTQIEEANAAESNRYAEDMLSNIMGLANKNDNGVKAQENQLKRIAARRALAKSKSTPVAVEVLKYIAGGLEVQKKASAGGSGNNSDSGEGTEPEQIWSESDEEEPPKTPARGR